MNGKTNKWILKAAKASKGTGITIHDSYESIINVNVNKDLEGLVAMKYIENPLTMKSHKMDMRVYVLVTDWDPLVIWAFEECYLRIAPSDYDLNNSDQSAHLTALDEGLTLASLQEFKDELLPKYGPNVWEDKIYPRIKQVIRASM